VNFGKPVPAYQPGDSGVRTLIRDGRPVTRENYVTRNWMDGPPDPWTAEDEEQLPPQLQDWSQFERGKTPKAY
jgi:hypothetical protein